MTRIKRKEALRLYATGAPVVLHLGDPKGFAARTVTRFPESDSGLTADEEFAEVVASYGRTFGRPEYAALTGNANEPA